ncbi:MAG: hypothetical protein HC904_07915 [Blastochloris sp.]|nr:hypothetical protein [Blastochloris sp.]
MKNIKFQLEHVVLTVVLAVFGLGLAYLAMSLPEKESLVPTTLGKSPAKIPFETLETVAERVQKPLNIEQPGEGKPVFVSRMVVFYPKSGEIEALDKDKLLPGPEITAAWLLRYNLSIEDVNVGSQDPDGDGFSNKEEFDYKPQTNPINKESHPPIIAKLRVKKFNPVNFDIEFKGRVQGADGLQFQVKFKNASKLFRTGDRIEDYKIGEYREKIIEEYIEAIKTTVKRDVSELDITFLKLNQTITLVLNQRQISDESTVEFVLRVPGGKVEPAVVKRGDSFKVRDKTYQVLKASAEGAVIRDLEEKDPNVTITIPMMK